LNEILAAILFLQTVGPASAPRQATLASLIQDARVIVVAEISSTDYSQTPADGPMIARARVLHSLKGELRKDQSISFTEAGWVGPSYKPGEARILFLEPASGSWRVLSNLYAKADFLIERDAIARLNLSALQAVLEKIPAPTTRPVLITGDMLK
jgi:hypothetical protein